MARTRSRLTALKVASIKKPGLYADGGSLYLRVAREGSKGWIFRFTVRGRTRDAGLGSYPTISLVKARESTDEYRRQVAAGIDPIEARNEERAAKRLDAARALTFEQCAKSYMASHEVGWKNDKHRAQWRSTLATYAFPVIGALPVKAIDTATCAEHPRADLDNEARDGIAGPRPHRGDLELGESAWLSRR